ncbi:hypothetical protein PR048_026767 [Dryococelus australis]|uniref:Uncharacterized protein n=1 Tax=Dryococelus australis TaxID=614101 RepID=A0ABQ9GM97_9NEOP|nr:hypothetical protein PR048_026767 [Dryococelus australis]
MLVCRVKLIQTSVIAVLLEYGQSVTVSTGMCILALGLALLACSHVHSETVTAIHVSQWEQYRVKCDSSSPDYDPSIFPIGNLDDCNKYFECRGHFLPMFHCADGQDFNSKVSRASV